MKQHITVEQAQESPYKFAKLMSQEGESCQVFDGQFDRHIGKNQVELINIGRMIEMLRAHMVVIEFLDHSEDDYNYVVQILINEGFEEEYLNFENFELCDALWEAVKIVLNED